MTTPRGDFDDAIRRECEAMRMSIHRRLGIWLTEEQTRVVQALAMGLRWALAQPASGMTVEVARAVLADHLAAIGPPR